jgi:hypothetical protein
LRRFFIGLLLGDFAEQGFFFRLAAEARLEINFPPFPLAGIFRFRLLLGLIRSTSFTFHLIEK